jgi:DNA polymerase-1
MFPAYQSGREFDDDLIEQLNVLPELVAAFGFANAKAHGYAADDFLAAAVTAEERTGGSALVASGDRDSFQLASRLRHGNCGGLEFSG